MGIGYITTYGLDLSDTSKWVGAAATSDGRVVAFPDSATDLLVIDTALDTGVRGKFGLLNGWSATTRPVVASDGRIVAVSRDQLGFVRFTPSNSTFTVHGGSTKRDIQRVSTALVSGNTIYSAPFNTYYASEGVVKAVNQQFPVSTVPISLRTAVLKGQFSETITAPNGLIYCIPYDRNVFGIIDPSVDSISYTDFGLNLSTAGKWTGAVIIGDIIYGIPGNITHGILEIDTTNGTAAINTSYTGIISGGNTTGVVGLDGFIYCMPGARRDIQIIDPVNKTVTTDDFGITLPPGEDYNIAGGALSGHRIFGVPGDGNYVLVLNSSPIQTLKVTPRRFPFRVTSLDLKADKHVIPEASGRTGIRLSRKNYTHEFARVMHVGDIISIAIDWDDLLIGSQETILTFGAESRDLTVGTITFDARHAFIQLSDATTTDRAKVTMRVLTSDGRELVRDIIVRTQYEPPFPVVPTP